MSKFEVYGITVNLYAASKCKRKVKIACQDAEFLVRITYCFLFAGIKFVFPRK